MIDGTFQLKGSALRIDLVRGERTVSFHVEIPPYVWGILAARIADPEVKEWLRTEAANRD